MPGSIDPLRDIWRGWSTEDAAERPWRLLRVAALFVLHALLGFIEAISEFGAPVLLVLGVVWAAAPGLLAAIHLDGPGADLLTFAASHLPQTLDVGGSRFSAHGLIVDGVTLFAVAAICRSAGIVVARGMVE